MKTEKIEQAIGITYRADTVAKGRIKSSPEEFVVQEVGWDGEVANLEGNLVTEPPPSPVYRATLVKTGLSTTEARHILATALDCPIGNVSMAGRKDVQAVTAQFVTVHDVPPSAFQALSSLPSNLRIYDLRPAGRILHIGQLQGNRFTVRIRTDTPVDETLLLNRLRYLETGGFPNFFGPQRFGPRVNNHLVGEQILRSDYDAAARLLLTHTTPFESPRAAAMRHQADTRWGDWPGLARLFSAYPHAFRSELALLSCLRAGKPAVEFWRSHLPQARFYTYAFASYLFNLVLSKLLVSGKELPVGIPVLSSDPASLDFYADVVQFDPRPIDVEQAAIPALRLRPYVIPATLRPRLSSADVDPESIRLYFELPKGGYATTFLSQVCILE